MADRREIGTIDDIVIHEQTHQVAYAILKVDSLLGFGQKRIPIPIEFFEVDNEKPYRIKLNIARNKLKGAPKCSAENLSSICQGTFLNTIREYYHSEPVLSKPDSRLRKLF